MIPFRLVLAALVAVPLAAPSVARAADWAVDPAKSRIGFSGTQVGAPFKGRFTRYDARIDFDPAKPEAGKAVVLIDLTSAETGDKQRDEALPQADWFNTSKDKQARFEATRFVAKGGDAYDAVGTLTIRGLRKDVTLPFTLTISGGTAHAVGHLDLVRTDYGVGQGSWANDSMVALQVGVDIDVTASAKSGG
ncbi:polyisoprenoid-binding protein [Methylobacterium indicum]|uniref:Polyisoprenoid-binding protein n=1 Tax=Methylobacterium indicum TaxID=1775910 RepID=A0A0J6QXQ1_9HYPH|nr:YceI family protein [Methylobacterium indicum]KMO14013.1 polyisoprenoid-binding protein [Methylobacterium indicum]KMO23264.1 polyisoprenoid-binding protein [Methylobacterium indicum]KTS35018.1 polyisoprenoid-binding protein [Methylobacterium indicum]KTS39675.1 polyisoprenoid-binding protein [Methylobacterium indicum]KTS51321.1 polyisoprenoid-binding protein [Methylobacterium indicum]